MRRNLARTSSVAQSDLGVSYRGCFTEPEAAPAAGGQPGAEGSGEVTSSLNHPASVRIQTIELRQRVNKEKVKIRCQQNYIYFLANVVIYCFIRSRYPFRSTSRPRLTHKINLQMEKAEGEES